jgi:hypothetical protein
VQDRAVQSFCLAATEQLRPDRQASGPAVDSTLSDHESHGERAHSRRYVRSGSRAVWPPRHTRTNILPRAASRCACSSSLACWPVYRTYRIECAARAASFARTSMRFRIGRDPSANPLPLPARRSAGCLTRRECHCHMLRAAHRATDGAGLRGTAPTPRCARGCRGLRELIVGLALEATGRPAR